MARAGYFFPNLFGRRYPIHLGHLDVEGGRVQVPVETWRIWSVYSTLMSSSSPFSTDTLARCPGSTSLLMPYW